MLSVPFLDLKQVTAMHAEEIQQAVSRVVSSGWYLLGEELKHFEGEYARYIGTRHCIGCGNGLDALTLMLRAYMELGRLHEGDEVIVPANTYIATILAITENHLRPVLVEPSPTTLLMEAEDIDRAITTRTRAVMIVHLYGRLNYSDDIERVIKSHGLLLFEDNAQAHGCRYINGKANTVNKAQEVSTGTNTGLHSDTIGTNTGLHSDTTGTNTGLHSDATGTNTGLHSDTIGTNTGLHSDTTGIKTGSLGDAAAHSFYPGKNLGALGDGGAVTTDDDDVATLVRALANYGSSRKYVFPYEGRNSRLDELQATVLSVKLRYLDEDNSHRRAAADYYRNNLSNPLVTLPEATCSPYSNVYHLFPVLCAERDRLQQHLADCGIGTVIHYPIPPHLQDCYKGKGLLAFSATGLPVTERLASEELSLPISPYITKDGLDRVVEAVNSFI